MNPASKIFYRRRLPHYQPSNETFHVTFRLAGSLPNGTVERLKREHAEVEQRIQSIKNPDDQRKARREWGAEYFRKYDEFLDRASIGPYWLRSPEIADLALSAIRYRDKGVYDLLTTCIMPNHVHLLVAVQRSDASLYRILQSLKSYTAREANAILGRSGAFWHHESYDHVIRDNSELERTAWYILNNPVKAGLCKHWRDWRWTYLKEGVIDLLDEVPLRPT